MSLGQAAGARWICAVRSFRLNSLVLPISALTPKDRRDLDAALELGADWIALSFVQRPEDVAEARALIGARAGIVAKLEKPSAIEQLEAVVQASDAIMIARGDLAVECGFERLAELHAECHGTELLHHAHHRREHLHHLGGHTAGAQQARALGAAGGGAVREQQTKLWMRRTQGIEQHSSGAGFTQRHGVNPDITLARGDVAVIPKALIDGVQIARLVTSTTPEFASQQGLQRPHQPAVKLQAHIDSCDDEACRHCCHACQTPSTEGVGKSTKLH